MPCISIGDTRRPLRVSMYLHLLAHPIQPYPLQSHPRPAQFSLCNPKETQPSRQDRGTSTSVRARILTSHLVHQIPIGLAGTDTCFIYGAHRAEQSVSQHHQSCAFDPLGLLMVCVSACMRVWGIPIYTEKYRGDWSLLCSYPLSCHPTPWTVEAQIRAIFVHNDLPEANKYPT